MNINVLRHFLVVANERNISNAANSLNIAQSTLSGQMIALEEELGVTLLKRGNRQVTLTDEGVYFLKKARDMIALSDKTKLDLQSLGSLVDGEVYIGVGETRGMQFIADTINQVKEQFNYLKFHFHGGTSQDILDKLDNNLIDFGVLTKPASLAAYESITIPVSDQWGALIHREHPLASEKIYY